MEEKELTQRFQDVFEEIISVADDAKRGFFSEQQQTLDKSQTRLKSALKSRLALVEQIIEKKDKGETEKKFVALLMPFQATSLAMENLMSKMEIKVGAKVLFSSRALKEVEELFNIVLGMLRDTKDFITTGNPHLRSQVRSSKEKLAQITNEYAAIHQNRLITGVCMPQASYLYLDMVESFKRMGRGIADFAEKV
jgi:Na+/phosphate symporter